MANASDADRGFTDRVLKSYSGIEDSRLRSLVLALIRHLHAYVGETKLTDQEWEFAWNLMGRMAAVPDRNEFLLLGDVLGVSQLIETLNHAFTLVIHLPSPSRHMPQRTRRGALGAGAGGPPPFSPEVIPDHELDGEPILIGRSFTTAGASLGRGLMTLHASKALQLHRLRRCQAVRDEERLLDLARTSLWR
jgi:hypothetical protein